MLVAMLRAGYAAGFAAAVTAAAGSTDILIPPSVAFIVYSVLVPSATVPALFVGGVIPGILACLLLIIPALFLSFSTTSAVDHSNTPRPKFWPSFKDASWALAAPVLILGGLRTGWFTPTEAAVMAVVFGLFVGFVIYRSAHPARRVRTADRVRRNLGGHPDRGRPGQRLRLGHAAPSASSTPSPKVW